MCHQTLLKYITFLFFVQVLNKIGISDSNVIQLNQGVIQGNFNSLHNYWTYFGVPYASFKGRFKNPGDPPSWNGIFKANQESPVCKQLSQTLKSTIGQEDCMNLNIYTPIAPNQKSDLLSVMVFIPGGGFYKVTNEDQTYNGRYLVQKGVVFVTMKYRIGAFGFLCLQNEGAPGNMGLKDQLSALRWVKNNIIKFGGNPNSITLFGQSVGAASVDYFILTKAAKGLFQRAILHSGSAITTQVYDKQPVLTASTAALLLGYNTSNTDELLNVYLNATSDDLARVSFKVATNNPLAPYIFKPCIEDPDTSNNAVLTSIPRDLLNSEKDDILNISILMGMNNKEGIMWAKEYDSEGLSQLDNDFTTAIPNSLAFRKAEDKSSLINDIKEFYFKNSKTDYGGLINYYSDIMVMYPVVVSMDAYLTNPSISLYNYYFTYDSLRNLRKLMSRLSKVPGAAHTDEMFYLVDPKRYRFETPIPEDMEMIDRMTTLWTNFAKTGVPSADNICWPRSVNTLKFLKLDNKPIELIDLPNKNRINFWRKAYEKYQLQ